MDIYSALAEVLEYSKKHSVDFTITDGTVKTEFQDNYGKLRLLEYGSGNLNKIVSSLPHNF